ncbi:hypothetical protein HZB97_01190 [Candidatus Gottesmanbacteria bacterium]|nr:hypothetical protein [Candidatus Gottesmanbacteria bacterium]
MTDGESPVKKTRSRKTVAQPLPVTGTTSAVFSKTIKNAFEELLKQILESKTAYEDLEKEISETKQRWVKEQKEYEFQLAAQAQEEEIARKREAETYAYESELAHKRAEDLFKDKLAAWEKELAEKKEEIAKEREELEDLRGQAAGFPAEKEKAAKEAWAALQKELAEKTATENRLREQEFKNREEILGLKIANLTEENSRLGKEVERLKQALEEASRQLKEVALKVIESGGATVKMPSLSAEKGNNH